MGPAFLVIFLLLCNAFFVAAEFAMVSLRNLHLEQLRAAGKPRTAKILAGLKERLAGVVGAIQVGITVSSLLIGTSLMVAAYILVKRSVPYGQFTFWFTLFFLLHMSLRVIERSGALAGLLARFDIQNVATNPAISLLGTTSNFMLLASWITQVAKQRVIRDHQLNEAAYLAAFEINLVEQRQIVGSRQRQLVDELRRFGTGPKGQ